MASRVHTGWEKAFFISFKHHSDKQPYDRKQQIEQKNERLIRAGKDGRQIQQIFFWAELR